MNTTQAASRTTLTKRRRAALGALAAGALALGIALPASASATAHGSASGAVTSQAKQAKQAKPAEGGIPADDKTVPCKTVTIVIADAHTHTHTHKAKAKTGPVQPTKPGGECHIKVHQAKSVESRIPADVKAGQAKPVEGTIPAKGKGVTPAAGTVVIADADAHKTKALTTQR
ncbi:hypothetical protein [Streptomyces sp. NPDC054765]